MATQAHCAFAFECLAASFEHRQPLRLRQVDELWHRYHDEDLESEQVHEGAQPEDEESDVTDEDVRPAAISRLPNHSSAPSAASSESSLPISTRSTASSTPSSRQSGSGTDTPASSRSSLLSTGRSGQEKYPLFVTWNTNSRGGHKSLRGCIGTFEPLELENGLRSYALTSAFEDVRFSPIPDSELPSLSAHVTLLINSSQPTKDPLDWTLGIHGIRISFTLQGRRYGSTYLPDVAMEQGWTKEETLVSLMRKAGWTGSSSRWAGAWKEGRGELVRYEGKAVGLHYNQWREWRVWASESVGVRSEALK
ncbi:hypothetical protein LTR56_023602 [Elasticomyces elasticus]|nr:hypothetical protein LTR56_023602 [Elasticomyces elasticus]KAK3662392.1 hypothetical protein LTR22_006671 [Elasticomyces elasticus]KAK4926381.1 hypothetical protein LTR49_006588 [Elasticomyces elasticus]KAK5737741.1 hypothetical protein LTS12_025791 [Elasticomyces elasticus]